MAPGTNGLASTNTISGLLLYVYIQKAGERGEAKTSEVTHSKKSLLAAPCEDLRVQVIVLPLALEHVDLSFCIPTVPALFSIL